MVQGWDWPKEKLAPNLGDASEAEGRERAGDLYQQSDMVRTIQQYGWWIPEGTDFPLLHA